MVYIYPLPIALYRYDFRKCLPLPLKLGFQRFSDGDLKTPIFGSRQSHQIAARNSYLNAGFGHGITSVYWQQHLNFSFDNQSVTLMSTLC